MRACVSGLPRHGAVALSAMLLALPCAMAGAAEVVIDVVRFPPRVGVGMAPVFYVPRTVGPAP